MSDDYFKSLFDTQILMLNDIKDDIRDLKDDVSTVFLSFMFISHIYCFCVG